MVPAALWTSWALLSAGDPQPIAQTLLSPVSKAASVLFTYAHLWMEVVAQFWSLLRTVCGSSHSVPAQWSPLAELKGVRLMYVASIGLL